jgi:hypothetical protein
MRRECVVNFMGEINKDEKCTHSLLSLTFAM